MNREYHPDWKQGGLADRLPDLSRREGESTNDWMDRRAVIWGKWQADHPADPTSGDLGPCSVGTFDGNGAPKGRGWA